MNQTTLSPGCGRTALADTPPATSAIGFAPEAPSNPSPRLTIAAMAVPLAIVALFAGLVPLGKWQLDEYDTIFDLRVGGLGAFFHRLSTLSFRPVSEALIYLYARWVEGTGQQATTRFLGFTWLVLIGAMVLPAALQLRRRRSPVGWALLLLALTTLVLFLNSQEVGEVFYWPQGSFAYMPAIAALAFATLWIVGHEGDGPAIGIAVPAALVVAAFSNEMGAMAALAFALSFLVLMAVANRRDRDEQSLAWFSWRLAAPIVASLSVFAFIVGGRLRIKGENVAGSDLHNLAGSLSQALVRFPEELVGWTSDGRDAVWITGMFFARVALFVGAFALFRTLATRSRIRLLEALALVAGLFGGAFVSLLASYYQFGSPCCQRHSTMRECLFVLGILALARVASLLLPAREEVAANRGSTILVLFIGATLLATIPNATRLRADYADYDRALAARAATWASGSSPGRTMTFTQPPLLRIVGGQEWPPGLHERTEGTHWIARIIMDFFRKDVIDMRPAGAG